MKKRLIKKSTINKFYKWLLTPSPTVKKTTKKTPILEIDDIQEEVIFIGYGNNLIIPVYGEQYGQSHTQKTAKELYKKYGEKIIDFSLAPQDDYQKKAGWPEEPFTNVLPRGNFVVSKDSWLGYIAPFEPERQDGEHLDRQEYTDKLIKLSKLAPVIVKGKIIKEGSEYSIILFGSHKEIDENLKKLS